MGVRTTALLIFCLSLWSFAVLAPQDPGDDQVVTRLGLVLSILDRGSLEISQFTDWTGDKAIVDGRVYADKAPGHPLLALPAVALDRLAREKLGLPTASRDLGAFYDYARWGTIGSNGVISALATAVLFFLALELGASLAGSVFAAMSLSLATPFLGWSTAFFAHSVSGSLLLIALALIVFGLPSALAARQRPLAPLLLGLVLGYCCTVDLTTGPAVVVLGALGAWNAIRSGRSQAIVPLVAGGALGVLPLFIYNALAFGSPLHLGYSDTSFRGMAQGIFGVGWPNPAVALRLLFGLYRGLLPLSPVLLLVPVGLVAMLRRPGRRWPGLAVLLIVLIYLSINAGYYYWDGGFSTGPRHLVPMLPPAALALAFAWPRPAPAKLVAVVLLAASLVLSLACALAGMFAPDTLARPLTQWVLPRLFDLRNSGMGLLVLPVWIVFALLLARADRSDLLRTGSAAVAPPSAPGTGPSAAAGSC